MRTMLMIVILAFFVTGCADNSTDAIQRVQTEKMAKEAALRVGPPGITNYTEKRFMKLIYELRDKEVKTYSYFMDMNGRLHFLCDSIGFGVPASVQYVNPQRRSTGTHGTIALPQPEPNGLFMPDSLSATYVLCSGEKGKLQPVYSEPALIVSPFKLRAATVLR